MSTIKSSDEHLTLNADGAAKDLKLQTNGTERAIVKANGNVGIGTSSPTEKLDVRGSVKIGKDGVSPYLTFDEVPDSSSGSEFYLTHDISGNILKFTDDNSHNLISMDRDNGNVGIGTNSPSEKLYVSGNIYATGNVTAYSDERIKKDIKEIPNALDAVDSIRGVSYTRTDTEEDSVGVIAQEVEALFPELITEDNEGMKSVNYNGLIGVLFSAVKELSAKVKKLEAK